MSTRHETWGDRAVLAAVVVGLTLLASGWLG